MPKKKFQYNKNTIVLLIAISEKNHRQYAYILCRHLRDRLHKFCIMYYLYKISYHQPVSDPVDKYTLHPLGLGDNQIHSSDCYTACGLKQKVCYRVFRIWDRKFSYQNATFLMAFLRLLVYIQLINYHICSRLVVRCDRLEFPHKFLTFNILLRIKTAPKMRQK